MSAIRNIEQEAKHVNEMFPDIDYLVIIELLNECRSVDDVIEQILSGNQSVKWKKSKADQKKSSQNQSQQPESNSIQSNNSTNSIHKPANQKQSNNINVAIPKHDQQTTNFNNDKNVFINSTSNKQIQLPPSKVSSQIDKQNQLQSHPSESNEDSFSSVINPPSTIPFSQNIIQQHSNNPIHHTSFNFQVQDYSFDSVLHPNPQNQSPQSNEINKQEKYPILTLPKYLQCIKPNMSRFGSFAGPINTSNQNTNLTLNYSSSSSTSSLNLYTSPPSSYNSASTKISLSSEENKFESFQPIITKDVTTQLDTYDDQNSSSIDGIGYGIDSINDMNRENNGETVHQVKYRNLQNPGYLRYQTTYSPLVQAQQMQQFQQQQRQLQQQQIFQQQQQQLIMQMQTPNFQPLSQQQQTPQIFSPQYMPPDPKFMVTQQQMVSQFNLAMPQNSQENVVGNK